MSSEKNIVVPAFPGHGVVPLQPSTNLVPLQATPATGESLVPEQLAKAVSVAKSEFTVPSTVPFTATSDLRATILAARKSPEQVAGLLTSKKEFVTMPIMKPPSKGKYWRARGGPGWRYQENSFLFLPSDFDSDRREFLLIHPDLEGFVQAKTQLRTVIKTFGLAMMVDVFGNPAYWALNLGDTGNWGTSARMIAEELQTGWGMVCPGNGSYTLERPEEDLGDPPWPAGAPEDWLEKAFKDRVIDSEDHPEIKKLLGKK